MRLARRNVPERNRILLIVGYQCDRCDETVFYRYKTTEWVPSKKHLIKMARNDGWSIGKRVLCQKCKRQKKSGLK